VEGSGVVGGVEIVLPGVTAPEGLVVRRTEVPEPGAGQVLVRTEATGVSFAEQQMRRGRYFDQPPFPFVPGYDLVGKVEKVGAGVAGSHVGRRYAAMTKVGAWASHVLVDAADLVPVPDGLDPAEAVTMVVNGLTAYQMLHRKAKAQAGQTVLVLGANGGVGSTLVQLAEIAGVTAIGTASARHHDTLRALGVIPVDYRDQDLVKEVRGIAPGGVDAVFDHVGGRGLKRSWELLAEGGVLVSYGTAATKESRGSTRLPVLKNLVKLLVWDLLPNGRRAMFYNIWAGKARNAQEFRTRTQADLEVVFGLLASGDLRAQVAARLPLTSAAEALALAESGTVTGKVVLLP
jgi:NADPH:quinone reductase-like Zn-dependent oxidoreductase